MNIFLAYSDNVAKSVEALDDRRLNKQILECYQLLTSAIKEKNGEKPNGWYKHPVYVFYRDNIPFLAYYGYECCRELAYRNGHWHSLTDYFDNVMIDLGLFEFDDEGYIISMEIPKFTPLLYGRLERSAELHKNNRECGRIV